ncbi:hypothetical protein B0H13DRAFT_2356325 [Mycena leptocephala]|nr:hypothetical protein B0H13DRAFT_2356325 [Mycena leptocephala]
MSESRVRRTCQRYCKGGKNFGRSTWYEHAPHRAGSSADHQGSSESSDDDSAESSSHSERNSDANAYIARETGTTVEDRPAKRRRIEDDPKSDNDELDIDHLSDDHLSSRPSSPIIDDQIDPGSIADVQPNSRDETVIDDHPDTETVPPDVKIEDIQQALDFIQAVQNASLENGDLDDETVDRLRNPIQNSSTSRTPISAIRWIYFLRHPTPLKKPITTSAMQLSAVPLHSLGPTVPLHTC